MTTNYIKPPLCMRINIVNPFQVIGIENQYTCAIQCVSQTYDGGSKQFTCSDIQVGYWVSNFVGGQSWKIIEITSVNTGQNSLNVVIEDVEFYNYSLDPTTGEHGT